MAIPSPRNDALGGTRPGVPIDWYSEQEHRRKLAEATNNLLARVKELESEQSTAGAAAMSGIPSSFTLNATKNIITNYDNGGETNSFPGSIDISAGTITINETGIYRLFGHAVGNQGNNTKEENALMFVRGVDSGGTTDLDLASFDIATDKTTVRSWNPNRIFTVTTVPVTVSLGLYATAGLGTFTFTDASFEIDAFSKELAQGFGI